MRAINNISDFMWSCHNCINFGSTCKGSKELYCDEIDYDITNPDILEQKFKEFQCKK